MATFRQNFFSSNKNQMFEIKIAKCKKRKKKVKNRRYLFEDMLTDHIYEVVQGHTLDRLKRFLYTN